MTEQEVNQLAKALLRSRESFIKQHGKAPETVMVRRKTERDRELMKAFRNR